MQLSMDDERGQFGQIFFRVVPTENFRIRIRFRFGFDSISFRFPNSISIFRSRLSNPNSFLIVRLVTLTQYKMLLIADSWLFRESISCWYSSDFHSIFLYNNQFYSIIQSIANQYKKTVKNRRMSVIFNFPIPSSYFY